MKFFKYTLGGTRSRSVTALLLLASVIALTFAASAALAAQAPVPLNHDGTGAASFGALSSAAMTNAGLNTVVNGDVGSSTSIDAGVTHPGHSAYGAGSMQLADAQASLLFAYNNAEAQTPTGDITGVNLAGQEKHPGVYNSTGAILISGPIALTLNGDGNADAVFIFQAAAAGDLTVDPLSSVTYTNGAQPCNVFWKVQSAFLKNTGKTFVGTILALTQITLTDNITVEGRVLARNADVTFIHDVVNVPSTCISQAAVDAAAAAAAQAAAQAAAAQAAAVAAKAAADKAEAAKAAADKAAAEKAAADAAAAAKAAADAAAKAVEAAAAAAAVQAATVEAARVAAEKAAAAAAAATKAAKEAKAAAARAAHAAKVAAVKAAAKKARQRTHAKQALRRAGLTG